MGAIAAYGVPLPIAQGGIGRSSSPSFSVFKSSAQNNPGNDTWDAVTFNNIDWNVGGGFQGGYIFYAPIAGFYFFNAGICCPPNVATYQAVGIIINGGLYFEGQQYSSVGVVQVVTGMMWLAAGGYAYVCYKIGAGGSCAYYVGNRACCYFQGHIVTVG
jgi:hypothetical protein